MADQHDPSALHNTGKQTLNGSLTITGNTDFGHAPTVNGGNLIQAVEPFVEEIHFDMDSGVPDKEYDLSKFKAVKVSLEVSEASNVIYEPMVSVYDSYDDTPEELIPEDVDFSESGASFEHAALFPKKKLQVSYNSLQATEREFTKSHNGGVSLDIFSENLTLENADDLVEQDFHAHEIKIVCEQEGSVDQENERSIRFKNNNNLDSSFSLLKLNSYSSDRIGNVGTDWYFTISELDTYNKTLVITGHIDGVAFGPTTMGYSRYLGSNAPVSAFLDYTENTEADYNRIENFCISFPSEEGELQEGTYRINSSAKLKYLLGWPTFDIYVDGILQFKGALPINGGSDDGKYHLSPLLGCPSVEIPSHDVSGKGAVGLLKNIVTKNVEFIFTVPAAEVAGTFKIQAF